MIDAGIRQMPGLASGFRLLKFKTLLKHDENAAMEFIREWRQMGSHAFMESAGALICTGSNFKKETYLYGIQLLQSAVDVRGSVPPVLYNLIAQGYAHTGDFVIAAEIQEKAVALAKQALKNRQYPDCISKDVLKEYQEKLATYKKGTA